MKIKLGMPVIVEGKYDKIRLSSLLDTVIITTDGFGIFKNEEKRALIKALAKERGVIVAADSDGAGKVIRSHLNGLVPPELIINVYIPCVKGKERRKLAPSREGLLGVEGMDTETLVRIFSPYASDRERTSAGFDPARLYELGLSGKENSAELRSRLSIQLGLPPSLSAKAFSSAVNFLYTEEDVLSALNEIKNNGDVK